MARRRKSTFYVFSEYDREHNLWDMIESSESDLVRDNPDLVEEITAVPLGGFTIVGGGAAPLAIILRVC